MVLIMADDLGYHDLGGYGHPKIKTPVLDRLAKRGVKLTAFYAGATVCTPSRMALMTGSYPTRLGWRKGVVGHILSTDHGLSPQAVTMAERFKAAGYKTAMSGKWHLGDDPTTQGFDINIAGREWGSPSGGGYHSPYKYPNLVNRKKGEYLTDRLGTEAAQFMEANKERPFFLYLTHYAVHTPIQAKPELTAKYEQKTPTDKQTNAKYAAMIESMDDSVGTVLDTLDRLKLADNTIVIFYADNGGHGGVTSNAPLRGSKGMLYEGGIRVPMAVRWPGVVKPGTTSDEPVIGIDLYPTLLEATQTKLQARVNLDGTSLLPLLSDAGASLFRPAIYWHFPAYLQGYTKRHGPFRTTPAGAIRMGDWKLIEYFEDGVLELYNLSDDIGEEQNLAKREAKRTAEMHSMMKAWRRATNAPVPKEKNPKFDPAAYKAAFNRR